MKKIFLLSVLSLNFCYSQKSLDLLAGPQIGGFVGSKGATEKSEYGFDKGFNISSSFNWRNRFGKPNSIKIQYFYQLASVNVIKGSGHSTTTYDFDFEMQVVSLSFGFSKTLIEKTKWNLSLRNNVGASYIARSLTRGNGSHWVSLQRSDGSWYLTVELWEKEEINSDELNQLNIIYNPALEFVFLADRKVNFLASNDYNLHIFPTISRPPYDFLVSGALKLGMRYKFR